MDSASNPIGATSRLRAALLLPVSEGCLSQLANVPTDLLIEMRTLINDALALQEDRTNNGEDAYPVARSAP